MIWNYPTQDEEHPDPRATPPMHPELPPPEDLHANPDAADSGNFYLCYTCGKPLPVTQDGQNLAPYRVYSREDYEGYLHTWVIRLCRLCADSWFE